MPIACPSMMVKATGRALPTQGESMRHSLGQTFMSGEDNREVEKGLKLPHQPLKWGTKSQLCPLAGAWHVKHLSYERKRHLET